jgi:hypothetical protein
MGDIYWIGKTEAIREGKFYRKQKNGGFRND